VTPDEIKQELAELGDQLRGLGISEDDIVLELDGRLRDLEDD
jgi:hypothetical protein